MSIDIRETLQNLDFQYVLDYDSNREVAYDHYERCANDYCRCSTISPSLNNIDHTAILEHICERFNITEEKTKYCIERICSTITEEDFNFEVCGGYYGQELESLTIDNTNIINKLEEILDIKKARKNKIDNLNQIAKNKISDDNIRKILVMEYGYLTEELKNSSFTIIEVDTNNIVLPQKEHANNLNQNKIKQYRNRKGICGIVKKVGNKYKVIDGYHRVTANMNKPTMKVILSE